MLSDKTIRKRAMAFALKNKVKCPAIDIVRLLDGKLVTLKSRGDTIACVKIISLPKNV